MWVYRPEDFLPVILIQKDFKCSPTVDGLSCLKDFSNKESVRFGGWKPIIGQTFLISWIINGKSLACFFFYDRFVLEPVSYIRKELEKKLQNNEEKIRSIEANKEYLQRSVKEHEDNIREMLASRPKWAAPIWFYCTPSQKILSH